MAQIGQPAPEIAAQDVYGNPIRLSSFRGKPVILLFHPEPPEQFEDYTEFNGRDIVLIEIHTDSAQMPPPFGNLDFPHYSILDSKQELTQLYGVWETRLAAGDPVEPMGEMRVSFLINERGVIIDSLYNNDPDRHVQQLRSSLDTLPTR